MNEVEQADPVRLATQLIKLTSDGALKWTEIKPNLQGGAYPLVAQAISTPEDSPNIEQRFEASFKGAILRLTVLAQRVTSGPTVQAYMNARAALQGDILPELKRRFIVLELNTPAGATSQWTDVQGLNDLLATVRYYSTDASVKEFLSDLFKS